MTKKRFVLKKCKLYDIGYNKDIPIATFRNVDDAEVIYTWLNELYEENEQLEKENKRLKRLENKVKQIPPKIKEVWLE